MTRPLVVVEDPDRDRGLVERARAVAVGEGTDLVVVALATPEEYEDVAATLDAIGRTEHTSYDEDAVLEGLWGDVDDLAGDVLGGGEGTVVAYDLHTQVVADDDQAEAIVDVADRTGCDHVFVSGRRRSPTGKAVFGDRTQQVILDFDGYVTVAMR